MTFDRAQPAPGPALSVLKVLAVLAALAAPLPAQQFATVTNFPGTLRWSEGLECADVDNDGDLDVFFADGGGFSSAGTQYQHLLFVNKLIETGPWTFVDESVARLGVHVSVAKGVCTGDIDADGWIDALFVHAFQPAVTPALYVNQGVANPGFFTFEGVARGLVTAHSSGSAQFGDLDDDGDLDLIIGDAYNTSTAGKPHLYLNNGAGVFSENAAALGAPNKPSQMDVQLADIDNDFDLDFVGFNKSTAASGAQYLLRNNGSATFSDSSSLIASNSGNCYEGEVGDLDNDTDLDLFLISFAGLAEGSTRNNLVGLGTLSFTNQGTFSGNDDNEAALFDYDIDGDYDVFVGALNSREFLFRNNGGFSFTDQSTQIQAVTDSTLDCTVADLNNDGKYDLLTVQGESLSAQWANKFYRNSGAADTLAPVLVGESAPLSAPSGGPVRVLTKIRDQVLDDGKNWVRGAADYVILVAPIDVDVSVQPAAFSPDPLAIPTGASVTWTNDTGAPCTLECTTAPFAFSSGTLAPLATFSHHFVSPGAYTISANSGAFTTTVTVTGTPTPAVTSYSGGQIYRSRFDDNANALGTLLVYEQRFTDWAGNVLVVGPRTIPLVRPGPGQLFCAGDGLDPAVTTACPCANFGAPAHGCAHSFNPDGALLLASGTVVADTVVLSASGMPASAFGLYMQHDSPGQTVFHDGVLCAGGTLTRLRGRTSVGGASQFPDPSFPNDATLTLSQRGGVTVGSGAVRYYATWYRNASTTFCPPATANVTNGLTLTW